MTSVLSRLVRGALLVGTLSVGMLAAEGALAAPPEHGAVSRDQPGPNRVRVSVKVVLATPNGSMDPRLQDIAKELRANFQAFQGFHLQSSHGDVLGPNQSTAFQFDGGRRASVTLVSKEEARARVRIEVFNRAGERSMDTTVWIPRGKSFSFGVKTQEGRLILPVSVDF